MKRKGSSFHYRLAKVAFLFLLAIFTKSQGGNENTYMYVDCGQPVFNPPGPVTIYFNLKYHIEGTGSERIVGFYVPILITCTNYCMVEPDTHVSVAFPSSSGVSAFGKSVTLEGSGPDYFHILYGAARTDGGAGVTGDSLFCRITVKVNSTCTIYIDTLQVQSEPLNLSDEQAYRILPGWGGSKNYGGYPDGGHPCVVATCTQPTYAVGTGRSVLNDTVNHIDTWFDCNNYFLHDVTRTENINPHGHNGKMQNTAYITTVKYGVGEFSDNDNIWNDTSQRAGVDAHVYTALTYDYMYHTLNLNGIDTTGKTIISIVNYPTDSNNIAFRRTDDYLLSYVITDTALRSYTGSLDAVAHEWAHGITKYASNLTGRREAGALNESFSDMFGVTVEWVNGSQNWVIAETSHNQNTNPPYYLRNLSNPPLREQADAWGEGWWRNPRSTPTPFELDSCPIPDDSNDSCWVTRNMGIPNKVFYLLSNGGYFNYITVTQIGIENAMKIMYRANKQRYWNDTTDFVHAATGSIRAAFDLNPIGIWPQQVSNAWKAVKVCDAMPMPGDVNATGGINLTDIIYLVNYVYDKSRASPACNGYDPGTCWPIDPLCRGDVSGDGHIVLADVIWLVNYVFDKSRVSPPCNGTDPGNCWLPMPSETCCRLP